MIQAYYNIFVSEQKPEVIILYGPMVVGLFWCIVVYNSAAM